MLTLSQLRAHYGAIRAVHGVTVHVEKGQLVALLGANGAGKSTVLNSVAGLHRQKSGRITLGDKDVSKMTTHALARRGLAIVPEGRMIVAPLTVEENLKLSSYAKRRPVKEGLEHVYELFPRLAERRTQYAGLMSGGEQQMLAMGRALMTSPDVLLLDEPSMGLAPSVIDKIYESIVKLHAAGQSILLVEQDATRALDVADRAYLLQRGEVRAEGTAEELKGSEEIQSAYLG